jgi:hypothetical protein
LLCECGSHIQHYNYTYCYYPLCFHFLLIVLFFLIPSQAKGSGRETLI